MTKIFLDTEFTGLHQKTTLISIALVAESGEEFYGEFTDYDTKQLNEWINLEVISNCFLNSSNVSFNNNKMHLLGTKPEIKMGIEIWLNQFGSEKNSLQFWGDCPAYDWVLFCQLFGGARIIPESIQYMCMDLATMFYLAMDNADENREDFIKEFFKYEGKKHNALYDAKVSLACYNKLILKKYA